MNDWPHPFRFLPVADSTNAVLKDLVRQGRFVPGAVAAREQTAGRGRGNNTWQSPPGGLYLSIALPLDDAGALPLVGPSIACAVAGWLRARFGVDVRIKWPNDWLAGGRKLGGMLLERVRDPQGRTVVIAGIGLNAFLVPRVPDRIVFPPTALVEWADLSGEEPECLCRELCAVVAPVASLTPANGPDLRQSLVQWSATLGQVVTVSLPSGGRIFGTAEDLAPDFSLCIRTGGRVVRVQAGDCFHGSPADREVPE